MNIRLVRPGVTLAWVVITITFLSYAPIEAHDANPARVPSVQALKVDAPLVMDGALDEAFWQDAVMVSDFTDVRTGQPATQQTRIRIAYTRTHLYVGVECLDDEMDKVHASEQKEDRFFQGDDWIEVHLDPTHSHRAKYAFFSNPLGTRVDASEGPGGQFSTAWSAEWDLAAKIHDDRWTFEMKIPWGILNYNQADQQTWGFNVTRKRIHGDVTSFWSFNDTDYYKPRYFGHLTHLDLADSRFDRNLEVTPYASSRVDWNSHTNTTAQTGADVSFRLTPSVITAWTVNPDFGQVESDADTIELRDTERFLPEKRLFFREGDELLRMPNQLYYSRRFSDIDAGAKASGDWQDFKFSLLNIYGDTVHGDTYHGNSSVVRVLQNVGEKSNLGYYMNASEFEEGHSRVAGTDGLFFLRDDLQFHYQLAWADDRLNHTDGSTKDRGDYLGHTAMTYEKYPWGVSVGYRGISKEFDPAMGYIPRRNIFGPSLETEYGLRSADKWYKSLSVKFESQYFENEESQVALRDYSLHTGFALHNDTAFLVGHHDDYHAPHHNQRTHVGVEFNESDYYRQLELTWAFGSFQTVDYDQLTLAKHFKPLEQWPIRYEFTIRFEDEQPDPDRDETIWLNQVVFDYFFSDVMWLKSAIQHRSTEVHNISLIYGWEVMKDAHWYLVYNNLRQEDQLETGQSVFTKVAYTFR